MLLFIHKFLDLPTQNKKNIKYFELNSPLP